MVIIILIMPSGDPTVFLSGLKGKPVINFDGNDLLWTSQDFDYLTNNGYTLLTPLGTRVLNNRVLSL